MRKQFMRVATMGIAGVLACAAWGDGIAVGYRQLGVVDVPDGAVSNVDSVVLGDQASLYKTGAGTLAINGGALKSVTDERLTVLEGAVSVTTSADADFTTPPAVCDLAAFWVNESSVATTNGVVEEGETPPAYVSKWLDVRETNPSSPTRIYALPRWCTSETYPATLYGIDPVLTTFDGRNGVYFGGQTSGQYMRWYTNGVARGISRIRHVFVVQAITNCVGHFIGNTDTSAGRNSLYLNTIGKETMAYDGTTAIAYPRADICKPTGRSTRATRRTSGLGNCGRSTTTTSSRPPIISATAVSKKGKSSEVAKGWTTSARSLCSRTSSRRRSARPWNATCSRSGICPTRRTSHRVRAAWSLRWPKARRRR